MAGGMRPQAAGLAPEAVSSAQLVFVGVTPCRLVDTRFGGGPFGGPSLAAGVTRTFPVLSSGSCILPSTAQAYSLNVTAVPPGFLGFLTIWPSGQPLPVASTLNSLQGFIVANAAIVPAGTNGSLDVYAMNPTDVIIDINGYYVPQGSFSLAAGSASAPALSFTGDSGTGFFSSGVGAMNIATGGINRLTVRADGDIDLPGSLRKAGNLFLHNRGTSNTAVGSNALMDTTGSSNTAVGEGALQANASGAFNTAAGVGALGNNAAGASNVGIGYQALSFNLAGSSNIAIGHQAGSAINLSHNITIGNPGDFNDNGAIRIGGPSQTRFFAAGVHNVTTGMPGALSVVVDSKGQLGTISSSLRYKDDIHDMGPASSGLLRLRPVTFRYRQPYADGSKPMDYGLIAEEVAEVYPDLVVRDADGQVETVQYYKLVPMLLNELKKQYGEVQSQGRRLRDLEARLAALEKRISAR
jgi:hypothetical protein